MCQRCAEVRDACADVVAFDEAMAEPGPNVPWEQVQAELGWS